MTAEEFERAYAERSGVTIEQLRRTEVILPCACGDGCPGWAAVANDPRSIKAHTQLYAPKD